MSLFGEGSGLGGIQTVGVVNSLKTGNVMIDMAIAMTIPVVLGNTLNGVSKAQTYLSEVDFLRFFKEKKDYHVRKIRHSTVQTTYSTTDLGGGDSQNELLIKAIQLYLDSKGILKLKNAELELRQIGQDDSRSNNYYNYYDNQNTTTLADTLSKYKVIKRPLKNKWLTLGKHGKGKDRYEVELMVHELKEDINTKSESVKHKHELTLFFKSEGKDAIDVFIDQAYKWYLGKLRALEDNSRYLYELKQSSKPGNGDGDGSSHTFKRYQLSDEKTFESLFFKEKDTILKIVDSFTNKTGKYAIKGYPNKLGLLLHGPPGTGKTSLIKALAQLTGRSIVNVPLARISTNAELASLFFDQKYHVDGERVPVKLGFKDVIFVMEDVDAVSKVVHRRDGKTAAEMSHTERVDCPIDKSLWRMMLESTNSDCQELVKQLIEKSKRLKEAAEDPSNLCSVAQRMSALPGLSLVGEDTENETASKIASDAIESAKEQMEKQTIVDAFIGNHAKTVKQMLESGTSVTEEFENELLGLPISVDPVLDSFVSLKKAPLSLARNASCKKDFGEGEDFIMEVSSSDLSNNVEYGPSSPMMEDFDSGTDKNEKKAFGIGHSSMSSWRAKRDELNLSGLLNVLDGVVDTPGRMLVMTSNHPEMLDPALIRPGRIDKQLLLSYLGYQDLVKMLEHYFEIELNDKQVERMRDAVEDFPALKLTPAQVEQLACEHENIEDMMMAIEEKKRLEGGDSNLATVPCAKSQSCHVQARKRAKSHNTWPNKKQKWQ